MIKRLLILTTAAMLTAGMSGCQCKDFSDVARCLQLPRPT